VTKRSGGGEKGDPYVASLDDLGRLGLPAKNKPKVETLIKKMVERVTEERTEEMRNTYVKAFEDKDRAIRRVNQKYEAVAKSYDKLGKEKKQTEAVVRSLADGLIIVNEKGETLLMNPAAEKLLGVSAEETVGKSLLNQQKEEQVISLMDFTGTGEDREIQVNSPNDQTKKIVRASSAVIENEFGQTMGMVSVLTDVTKQKEFDELKSKFVASVSHELRTPLNCIQESVNLLLDNVMGEVTKEQVKVLKLAQRNITRLTDLINDLLDLSKMEAGKFELKLTEFVIDDLVHTVKAAFDAWAKSKKVVLETALPPERITIRADEAKLTQVLTNLMGNSMKFMPADGKVTIEVRKVESEKGGARDMLEIAVRDNGPGISKEEQKKIFDKFTQAKSSKKTGGTGLGLTISKEIIELHGGRMWVESEEGRGSRFAFCIPQRVG